MSSGETSRNAKSLVQRVPLFGTANSSSISGVGIETRSEPCRGCRTRWSPSGPRPKACPVQRWQSPTARDSSISKQRWRTTGRSSPKPTRTPSRFDSSLSTRQAWPSSTNPSTCRPWATPIGSARCWPRNGRHGPRAQPVDITPNRSAGMRANYSAGSIPRAAPSAAISQMRSPAL